MFELTWSKKFKKKGLIEQLREVIIKFQLKIYFSGNNANFTQYENQIIQSYIFSNVKETKKRQELQALLVAAAEQRSILVS